MSAAERIEDERWAAVEARDAGADGSFLYGVVTTGIFCRPSCGARRPRRDNVRFFDTVAQAAKSGLRPCKRCRPTEPKPGGRRAELVARVCRAIDEAETAPTLSELATATGVSPFHLHRVFKQETGITPKSYAEAKRTARVRHELQGGAPVTDAIYTAGFGSDSGFYTKSNERLGMTPTEFRDGGAGVEVRFAVGQCSLGAILVAVSDRGVCAIEFGDDPESLVHQLEVRFHAAQLVGDDADFAALMARVIAMVEDPAAVDDRLPLDVRGTAFQERVWRALQKVPAGSTVSYAELAAVIGAPRSVRAVASACAANRLAVAIPCHRVVRADGALSGYRWGVDRKAALLARERP